MEYPDKPSNEEERLATLRAYEILDTAPEASFDRITALAAEICDAPIALVSLVDHGRQWFKSHCGLDATETPREIAFCAHAILQDDPFVIPSTKSDPRFQDNPLVTGPPHIKSYAGAPLITKQGIRVGTLCVIHTEAEAKLSKKQISQLVNLAAIAVRELDLRLALKTVDEAKQEAQSANAAKSQFLASISHEIRTPMNGVLGMANVLSATSLTPDQRDFVDTIKESGETLLDLLNDVLDLSKIEAGRIDLDQEDFFVADLFRSVENLWRPQASEKNVAFTIHNRLGGDAYIRTDRGRLRQILNNLVGNALKFTSEGSVDIKIEEITLQDDKLGIRFEVLDTGIGLSADQITHIFEPFAQADSSITRKFGGTGLGLSICKKLTTLLGGEIGVESTLGHGSNFWFHITAERVTPSTSVPVSTNASENIGTENNKPPSESQSLRVLLAEDNHINQKVVQWMLAPLDCVIEVVQNGLEAVAAVTRSPYDLVLMDVQMPVMDGITAIKKIREMGLSTETLPIIALTANAMQGDKDSYLGAGASSYLSKPIDQRDLWKTICRLTGVLLPELTDAGTSSNPEPASSLNMETIKKVDEFVDELDTLLTGTDK